MVVILEVRTRRSEFHTWFRTPFIMSNKRKIWDLYEKKCSEKRKGETLKKKSSSPSCIMVQRMSTEANRLKKFEPLDTRDFVDFSDFDEISIDNIKLACEKYYEMPKGSCDVLLSDRGPSCYLTEQIIGKKVYFIRFLDQKTKVCNRKEHERMDSAASSTPQTSFGKLPQSRSITVLPSVPSTVFPKSASIADLLQARKLIKPPDVSLVTMLLENYSVSDKTWVKCATLDFLKENKHFSEGGFRVAYIATAQHASYPTKWVIKMAKVEKLADLQAAVNLNNTQHTRKQVQMHSVVRSICQKFARKVPYAFGNCFSYNEVYFSTLNGTPVTVEEFIPGSFEKYSNNTALMEQARSDEHLVFIQKAECFMHFSYEVTNKELMVVDLQGVGYQLCDPEIASTVLLEDGELNFCAGNLSQNAIENFFDNHKCNRFCKMLEL